MVLDAVQMWNIQNSSTLYECLILCVNLNAIELLLQLLAYSFEYDPKAVDSEEKNSEHFNKFADESGIPKVSEHKFSILKQVDIDHKSVVLLENGSVFMLSHEKRED
jgi:hypothetical protein